MHTSTRVELKELERWAARQTQADDVLVLEASGNAFAVAARLRAIGRQVVILDVRREEEYAAARIAGAVNVPLHELPQRVDEVPDGEIWVHCAGGYRASVAASLLDANHRTPVAIDDSFDHAEEVGLHLVGDDRPDDNRA